MNILNFLGSARDAPDDAISPAQPCDVHATGALATTAIFVETPTDEAEVWGEVLLVDWILAWA